MSRIRRNRIKALAIAAAAVTAMAALVGSASGITIKTGRPRSDLRRQLLAEGLPEEGQVGADPETRGLDRESRRRRTPRRSRPSRSTSTRPVNSSPRACRPANRASSRARSPRRRKPPAATPWSAPARSPPSIQFPEQAPFGASGPLLIFNASKGNKQALLLHVYAKVPAPTTFVVPVTIKKTGGKYGTNAFIKVPLITSGQGSVTSFKAKIGKKWSVKGQKESLLNAVLPDRQPRGPGRLRLRRRGTLKGVFTKPCTPKG